MPYTPTDTLVGTQAIAITNDVQLHVLGTTVTAFDPVYGTGTFMYLKGLTGTIVGSVVTIDTTANTTTLTVAATRGPVGVAMSANIANQYGWYQVNGSAVVSVNTVIAGAPAFSTATPGTIDDAVVAGSKIDGIVFKTVNGVPAANLAVAQIAYPSMNGNG
jgi:hypothetical protein